jgi:acyl carrier protein phosphodiesterase
VNYLSHLLFSDYSEDALLGSLLGDFVKGSTEGRFSAAVADAILLHRKIDSFADAHMVTRQSRNRISPLRRRFAGIIVDVCYDHFLSRHWRRYGAIDLESFVDRVYAVLSKNRSRLPERFSRILPRMISENWLGSYIHLERVGDALDRIAGRLSRGGQFMRAVTEIEANYEALEIDFLAFFPDLAAFCTAWKHRGENGTDKSFGFNERGARRRVPALGAG